MSNENIVSLARQSNDGKLSSQEQCLRDCLADIGKRGAFMNGRKLLVLALDDADHQYTVSWAQAGMTMSECIALLRVGEQLFLNEMGYNLMPEDPEL